MAGPPAGTRIKKAEAEGWSEAWGKYDTERTWQVIDELLAIATETGKSPAQVALRWVLQRPGITAPIIGARTTQQLEDNLGATGWELGDSAMDRLTQVSSLELPYPYDVVSNAMSRR
jgi:aryl-alcohol dehydrogenase-like predicted oxidoreductase